MLSDEWDSDRGVEHRDALRRRGPRCYSRPGMSRAVSESLIDRENNVVLIGLSVITCVAAFMVVYGGWSF